MAWLTLADATGAIVSLLVHFVSSNSAVEVTGTAQSRFERGRFIRGAPEVLLSSIPLFRYSIIPILP